MAGMTEEQELQAGIEAFWESRFGWKCGACGKRGMWHGFAGAELPSIEALATKAERIHGQLSPVCSGVLDVGLAMELDPAMVATVRAAGITMGPVEFDDAGRTHAEQMLARVSAAQQFAGPWATPDMFR